MTGPLLGQEPIAQQQDFNVALLSNRQIEYPSTISEQYHRYSDIWGYTSAAGTEYAILGTGIGTAIYDLTDPANPTLTKLIPGALSRWRDFKSYGNYVFGVADEGTDGLLIVNMENAPGDITWQYWRPSLAVGNDQPRLLDKCHNLYIDSSFVFLAGCNLYGGAVLIFDLAVNPEEPVFISAGDRKYAHDVFVQDQWMYTSDLGEGFAIVDLTDLSQPQTIITQETSSDFTHNAWASDDGTYLFTTDERVNATIDAYDISNQDEIKLLDRYRPSATLRNPVIPHNVHYHNGYLAISYYIDGLKIVDAHQPDILVEVGSFDTYRFRDDGFHGAWGAFPFLPSGLILVSDIETGLYVLKPDYQRAAYLTGTITNQSNNQPLEGVTIRIDSEKPSLTKSLQDGTYKTGWAGSGPVTITFSKAGYHPKKVQNELVQGETTMIDLQLLPLNSFRISGVVLDQDNGEPIANAQVIAFNDLYEERSVTGLDGTFSLSTYEGNLTIAAGHWGYIHSFVIHDLEQDLSGVTLMLDRGYRDDFTFDYGWMTFNSANTSETQGWEKGNPRYAIYNEELTNPNGDLEKDFGKECFVTGLAGNLTSNLSDTSILVSPIFDLSGYEDPFINYYTWFYNGGVLTPDDRLQVFLGNNGQEVLVEEITDGLSAWKDRSEIRVRDFITPGDEMYLKIVAADVGNIHIYEAAIDGFSISEGQSTAVDEEDHHASIIVYPNPAEEIIYVLPADAAIDEVRIYNVMGKMVLQKSLSHERSLDINALAPGTYLVEFRHQQFLQAVKKIIKIR